MECQVYGWNGAQRGVLVRVRRDKGEVQSLRLTAGKLEARNQTDEEERPQYSHDRRHQMENKAWCCQRSTSSVGVTLQYCLDSRPYIRRPARAVRVRTLWVGGARFCRVKSRIAIGASREALNVICVLDRCHSFITFIFSFSSCCDVCNRLLHVQTSTLQSSASESNPTASFPIPDSLVPRLLHSFLSHTVSHTVQYATKSWGGAWNKAIIPDIIELCNHRYCGLQITLRYYRIKCNTHPSLIN